MSTEICVVYATVPDPETGEQLGREMVEARLAACANVLPSVTSIYHWEGEVQQDKEAVLILKTSRERYPELECALKAKHPYECPCIVSWDIAEGHTPYLDWVRERCQVSVFSVKESLPEQPEH